VIKEEIAVKEPCGKRLLPNYLALQAATATAGEVSIDSGC